MVSPVLNGVGLPETQVSLVIEETQVGKGHRVDGCLVSGHVVQHPPRAFSADASLKRHSASRATGPQKPVFSAPCGPDTAGVAEISSLVPSHQKEVHGVRALQHKSVAFIDFFHFALWYQPCRLLSPSET